MNEECNSQHHAKRTLAVAIDQIKIHEIFCMIFSSLKQFSYL